MTNYEEELAKLEAERKVLDAKIEQLQKEQAELHALGEGPRLANLMHSVFCRHNHIDGCSWQYETNDDFKRTTSTRWHWLQKANRVLAVSPSCGVAERIIGAIAKF